MWLPWSFTDLRWILYDVLQPQRKGLKTAISGFSCHLEPQALAWVLNPLDCEDYNLFPNLFVAFLPQAGGHTHPTEPLLP